MAGSPICAPQGRTAPLLGRSEPRASSSRSRSGPVVPVDPPFGPNQMIHLDPALLFHEVYLVAYELFS